MSELTIVDMTHDPPMGDVGGHMCDMTHSYAENTSFVCGTWVTSRDHIVDMTHRTPMGDVGGHMCDMTHSYAEYDSFMGVT